MDKSQLTLEKTVAKIHAPNLHLGKSPASDWKAILISTMILAGLVVGLGAFVFIKIDKGEIFVVERLTDEKEKTLDKAVLRKTVSYYEQKAIEFERIQRGSVRATDPSI